MLWIFISCCLKQLIKIQSTFKAMIQSTKAALNHYKLWSYFFSLSALHFKPSGHAMICLLFCLFSLTKHIFSYLSSSSLLYIEVRAYCHMNIFHKYFLAKKRVSCQNTYKFLAHFISKWKKKQKRLFCFTMSFSNSIDFSRSTPDKDQPTSGGKRWKSICLFNH